MKLKVKNAILKIKLKSKKLSIKKYSTFKNLRFISQWHGWKGAGTLEDPFIIDSVEKIPLNLTFTSCDSHLYIKNQYLTNLRLYHCQNITIDNCYICNLIIQRCQNITVKNNSILKIISLLSAANTFKNNQILKGSHERLLNNYYDKIASIFIYSGMIFGMILALICVYDIFHSHYLSRSISNLVLTLLAFGIISYYFAVVLQMKKLPPNKFADSKSVPLVPLVKLFNLEFKTAIRS